MSVTPAAWQPPRQPQAWLTFNVRQKNMCATTLNALGLVLNIIGVILVFFFGFPQPTHEEGIGLGLEDGTRLADGKTVAEHNEEVRKKKKCYLCMSRLALGLIIAGFVLQLWATLK
jgi:hypothetical protein